MTKVTPTGLMLDILMQISYQSGILTKQSQLVTEYNRGNSYEQFPLTVFNRFG